MAASAAEVETDLVQTGILLEEAIEKLSFNFMAIHAAVAAQQDTIALLLDGGIPMSSSASTGVAR